MTFDKAEELLTDGKKIHRKAWGSDNKYIYKNDYGKYRLVDNNRNSSIYWLGYDELDADEWCKEELDATKETLEKGAISDDERSELVDHIKWLENEIAEYLDFQQGVDALIEMVIEKKEG